MDLLEKALLELALVLLEEKRLITRKRSGKRATSMGVGGWGGGGVKLQILIIPPWCILFASPPLPLQLGTKKYVTEISF